MYRPHVQVETGPNEEQTPEQVHDLWNPAVPGVDQGHHAQVVAVDRHCSILPTFPPYGTGQDDWEELLEGDAFLLEPYSAFTL